MGRVKAFHLDSGGHSVGSNTIGDQLTNTIAPHAGRLVIVTVTSNRGGSGTPNIPTLSGLGMTWTQVLTDTYVTTSQERITVFRGMSTTPGSGQLTISHGGQGIQDIYWEITEFSNVVRTGSNGADAVVQSNSSKQSTNTPAVTLGAFSSPHNATYGVTYLNENGPAITPGNNFTEIDEVDKEHIIEAEFTGDNQMNVNWSVAGGTHTFLSIALELKASFSGGGAMLLL